jgi:hypothetical protein
VEADRGELVLRDRHLQPDDAVHREHLRERLRLQPRGGVRDRERLELPGAAAESSQGQGDHEHNREECEERESPSPTRCAHLPTFDAPPPCGA